MAESTTIDGWNHLENVDSGDFVKISVPQESSLTDTQGGETDIHTIPESTSACEQPTGTTARGNETGGWASGSRGGAMDLGEDDYAGYTTDDQAMGLTPQKLVGRKSRLQESWEKDKSSNGRTSMVDHSNYATSKDPL